MTPEYLAMNPNHQIPTLKNVTDGFCCWESNAILRYLCNECKLDKYYPTDTK